MTNPNLFFKKLFKKSTISLFKESPEETTATNNSPKNVKKIVLNTQIKGKLTQEEKRILIAYVSRIVTGTIPRRLRRCVIVNLHPTSSGDGVNCEIDIRPMDKQDTLGIVSTACFAKHQLCIASTFEKEAKAASSPSRSNNNSNIEKTIRLPRMQK